MNQLRPVVAAAIFLALAAVPARAADDIGWTPDLVHSRAEFTVSHLIVSKVWGHVPIVAMTFTTPRGSVIPNRIEVTLDVSHEDTDNHKRDADLRSAAYFDVEKYPSMSFRSTGVVASGPADFTVSGDLTVKGTTKSVTFPAHVEGRIPDGDGTRVGYSGQLHIDRRDFGLTDASMSPAGIPIVGTDVTIGLTVEATTTDASVRVKRS